MRKLVPVRMRGRRRGRVAIAAALTSCVALVGVASAAVGGFNPFGHQKVDGQPTANGILLPTNQWITPLGTRILDNTERLVSSTISPDGRYLAALGWNEFSGYLTIFDLQTGKMVSQTGLATGTGSDPGLLGRCRRASVLARRQHHLGSSVGRGWPSSASTRRPVRPR